jgi:L-2-hydroxyglutarate oxidase LhgO
VRAERGAQRSVQQVRSRVITHGGFADFVITRDKDVPRAIQLVGIESPGLTSSLAIAEKVVSMAAEILD